MKIFDCFPFNNELELLELRFMELYDTVDYFVLSEANITHTGKKKPYYFEENKDRYKKYLDKVIHVKVDDMPIPDKNNVWAAEHFQRGALSRALDKMASPGDKILVSDADEIVNPETLKKHINDEGWVCFKQSLFYYYVNLLNVNREWGGTVMADYGSYKKIQQLRRYAKRHAYGEIPNGGWHYSYLTGGDSEKAFEKSKEIVKGFFTEGLTKEEVAERVDGFVDVYKRKGKKHKMKIVDISNNKPKSMDLFLKKYPHFFFKG